MHVASLADRVAALEAAFRDIAATRMHGVPVLHADLSVQAVGFEAEVDGAWALGVLVTPWFMNLLRLPLQAHTPTTLAVGVSAPRDIGAQRFDFIGAHEGAIGGFEASSLFSPMFAFEDQSAAVATAREVLALLRTPPASAPAPVTRKPAEVVPSRRGFLFGRTGAAT
jgi:[NiFe] hydrogenase assembly HybE family chaperone